MPSPTIPFNFIPTEPSFTDALNLLKKDIMLNLNAHHVATIQSFNSTLQTATATINYPKTYFKLNQVTGLYSPYQVIYPILVDCPAIVLGGNNGATSLTFPISKGDECLVLFNDRDMGNWFAGGAGAPVATSRFHSFSDGIVLVGLRSKANVLSDYDTIRALLKGGSAVIGVNPSSNKIVLSNVSPSGGSYSVTIGTLLSSLITNLNTMIGHVQTLVAQTAAITVTPGSLAGPSSPPLNAVAITAVSAELAADIVNLSSVSSSLGGLLE